MNKESFKTKVIENAKEKLNHMISDFEKRIDGMKDDNNVEQHEYDQQSRIEDRGRRINKLADQLNLLIKEKDQIDRLKVEKPLHKTVGFGSVVLTDKHSLLVATSIEKFNVDDKEFIGVSMQAPIYKHMKGKSEGDSFSINSEDSVIKAVM